MSPLGKKRKSVCSGRRTVLIVGAAYGLTHVFSARAAYIHIGAMIGNDHGGQCVDAHPAGAKKNDCRTEGRSEAGRALQRAGKTAFEAEHVHGGAGGVHDDQQPLSRRDLRRSLQLDDLVSAGPCGLDRRKVYSTSVKTDVPACRPQRLNDSVNQPLRTVRRKAAVKFSVRQRKDRLDINRHILQPIQRILHRRSHHRILIQQRLCLVIRAFRLQRQNLVRQLTHCIFDLCMIDAERAFALVKFDRRLRRSDN